MEGVAVDRWGMTIPFFGQTPVESKELIAGYWIWQVRSMDEAIELAKRYGDQNSSQFVNGVLDVLADRAGLKHKGDEDVAVAKHQ